MKLTIVGGGSTYTPELVDGLARLRGVVPLEEVCLSDLDVHRMETVAGLSRRMFDRDDYEVAVTTTADPTRAIDGADIVLFQLRIGGQIARRSDELFPHCCSVIGQETTGPGGFAKALRTVPVILDLAEIVRERAKPEAWIIDFTNPVGIVTRALLEAGHRAVGLCNQAIGFQRLFAGLLGVAWDEVDLDHIGLNHLLWERAAWVDGIDRLGELRANHAAALAQYVGLPPALIDLQQAVPCPYLHYYYTHDEILAQQMAPDAIPRAEQVMAVEAALLTKYADPSLNTKPPELAERGGAYYSEAAVNLMASLMTDRRDRQVVNVRNDGVLPFLPDDHVIEVPARIGSSAITTDDSPARRPLDDAAAGLIAHVAAYERLALEAATRGGRDRLVAALLAHPLVGQFDKANKLADELIRQNRPYLPWAN
ncbi:MAG: 6-phospho-beta-glucosidase [Propionibacteriaceae bacterium]|jgi:6-phospho-beta-glucosidase|nr:6-phospho-beta-glucosidase [Propionibacteriaceae bacterium]